MDEQARAPRILIGMATSDMTYSLTALSFAHMLSYSQANGIDARPAMMIGSMLVNNVSNLAHMALSAGPDGWTADALLLIEWDMIFPPQALGALWFQDKDIIGATFMQRRAGGETHGFEIDDATRIDVTAGGPAREVSSIPMGFSLIRRRALEAMASAGDLPFFRWPFDLGAHHSRSQDYDFCQRARSRGFEVWVDPELSLAMGHVGISVYTIPRAAGIG